jgi:hypothetical protein
MTLAAILKDVLKNNFYSDGQEHDSTYGLYPAFEEMADFFAYIDTDKRENECNQAYECDGSEYTAGNQG